MNKWEYHWKTEKSEAQSTVNFSVDDDKVGFENCRCNSEDSPMFEKNMCECSYKMKWISICSYLPEGKKNNKNF